jgi:hypothetical protein
MEEGFAVDNDKVLSPPHPAYGERMSLGGSESWWRLSAPKSDKDASVGVLGMGFKAEKIIYEKQGIQIFTYRCQDCGYLEAYAPKRA